MLLVSALLFVAHAPLEPLPIQGDERRAAVRAKYEELAARRDAAGLATLWSENRDLILQTIDGDLEGGLAIWEESPKQPDQERIRELHERALFAALVASDAIGHPIFADYASSFVGWSVDERRSFRAGQAIYRRALDELKAENHDHAIAAAQETRERALPLGDWWGVAMGHAAEGRALQAGGHLEEALGAYSTACILYHDLGLVWSEYQNLRSMAEILQALERWTRAHTALQQALALARRFEDSAAVREILSARAQVERKLGREETAAATEAELAELGALEKDDQRSR